MPVEVQLRRYMLNPSSQVTELRIEQTIGIEGAWVEALAGGQGVVQLLALHVGEQVLALQQRVPGQFIQVVRDFEIERTHEDAAPGHEQKTVQRQQATGGRLPALRRVRQ
ncbi:hypothetical protein D3C76_981230 [compost metagenome]